MGALRLSQAQNPSDADQVETVAEQSDPSSDESAQEDPEPATSDLSVSLEVEDEEGNLQPVPGARVDIVPRGSESGSERSGLSDEKGLVTFDDLVPGELVVQVMKTGLKTAGVALELREAEEAVTIRLQREPDPE